MKPFKDYSIKSKLTAIILGIVSIMLVSGFGILGVISTRMILDIKKSESEALSKLIGEYSIAALDFNYPDRGKEILAKLSSDPNIVACHLFDIEGQLFTQYINDEIFYKLEKNFQVTNEFDKNVKNNYHILRKIHYNDKFYGWIYLIIDAHTNTITFTIIGIFSGLFVSLFLISLILANRLQGIISEPILELSNITSEISQSGRYNYRLEKKFDDEIGVLYNEFNNMLKAIEKREFEKSIAQQKVKENEQWIQTIINNLNDAIFVHDIKTGKIIYTNLTATKLYKYDIDEILQLDIADLSSNDDIYNQNSALTKLKKCILEGPQSFEWKAKNKYGKVFWVEVNMRKSLLNNIDRIMVVVKDIDERKKQREELSNLQNYLSDIIDSMPSIIIGTDENINITQWNREAEKFTNYSSDDIVGKKLNDIGSNLPYELSSNIQKSINNKEIIALEKEEIWNNNEKHFFNITIYPVRLNDGQGAVIRIDNVTDKINLEEMMIQSEKMLSVGGLAAGMAHEITPKMPKPDTSIMLTIPKIIAVNLLFIE